MEQPKSISIQELAGATRMACKILGTAERRVSSVARIHEADRMSVTFCNNKATEGLDTVINSEAGVVICYDDLQFNEKDFHDKTIILVADPTLAFTRIMRKFFTPADNRHGISDKAVVSEGAEVHPSAYIGPNSYIGKCKIGENTMIDGNVYIYPGAIIGTNVIIHAGAVIGAEGMGFHRNERGELEQFPQEGGVIIEDDVEIGANSAVMRPAMGHTIIGRGTKIGHLCTIGHQVTIGKHCIIVTQSVIGGNTQIGDHCYIALGSCIRNGVAIGNNVVVGMGSVVTKDVAAGKIVIGVPAKEQGETKERW